MTRKDAEKIYFDVREKRHAFGLLFYLNSLDIETGAAPAASIEPRSKQLSVVSAMLYDMTTSEDFKEAVRTLRNTEGLDPDLAHEIRQEYDGMMKLSRVPKEEYLAYGEMLNVVYPVYVEAKSKSDYSLFMPYLQKIFDYNRKYAEWVATEGKVGYDVLLDEYEHGYTAQEYDRFFELLRSRIVPLVAKIVKKPLEYNRAFLSRTFSKEGQKKFAEYIGEVMCFDKSRTAMLESEHPFTTNNGKYDVRITNHFYEDNLTSSIFSAIHEMGHGLYELQIDDKHEGTGNSGGTSLAMHESQSRIMENMFARSYSFWQAHFDNLREIFPEGLSDVTLEDFYRHINEVTPSLIRTEADELTYSLHVLIRYEIEKAVMDGKAEAKDIPTLWNEKYREYLGVEVPSDKEGCLQDVHWAGGSLGYFPTYSLGSAYAAQLYAAMERDFDIDEALRSGSMKRIAEWLGERVHRFGSSKFPKDIIKLATGEDFNPEYYVDYLEKKYTKLYNL